MAVIISDSVRDRAGRGFENNLKFRRADTTFFFVDNALADPLTPQILQAVKAAGKVVVAVYVSPVAGKQVMVDGKLVNSVGLEARSEELLRQILDAANSKTAVLAFGNPYILPPTTNAQTFLCTFSNVSTAELSAVKVLFGEIQPHGRLPVTLPGIAQRGFSLDKKAARKQQ